MIEITNKAPPYLVTGFMLASVSTLSFFKGVSTLVRLISPTKEKAEDANQASVSHEIFNACAWMGLSVLSGYGAIDIGHSFLDVPKNQYDFSYLKPFDNDLQEYAYIFKKVSSEQLPVRNFCMAAFRSFSALDILEQSEPSNIRWGEDPNIEEAKSTLRYIEQLDQQALVLDEHLQKRMKLCEHSFKKLKKDLKNQTVAKGVSVDFAQLCESSFSYLASTICTTYHEQKSYLDQYQTYQTLVKNYRADRVNDVQLERCQQTYDFDADLKELSNLEYIELVANTTKGELQKAKEQFWDKVSSFLPSF